jgi:hypothetical protein
MVLVGLEADCSGFKEKIIQLNFVMWFNLLSLFALFITVLFYFVLSCASYDILFSDEQLTCLHNVSDAIVVKKT